MPVAFGVDSFVGVHPVLLVALACRLDRLVGDPRWCLHPVVVMGWWINRLRPLAERWAGRRPRRLRLAGGLITLLLVGGSGLAGWLLERLLLAPIWSPLPGVVALLVLLIAMASAVAGRSLEQAVRAVLQPLAAGDLALARQRLSWIVGRDTADLTPAEILRAAAETASENAVDGLFAPLFWMLVGAALWLIYGIAAPGPLALAWAFKAASTLDSMLGYRRGRLRWLGTAGARLDDLLVWLPCRLVALSLPLVAGIHAAKRCVVLLQAALRDGAPDPSPNAGVSQAAYAHAAGVQMGGLNRYGDAIKAKPLLAKDCPPASPAAVQRILKLSLRLEALWLAAGLALGAGISAAQ
jgi:adenosylcobinamide-phosphate synthase